MLNDNIPVKFARCLRQVFDQSGTGAIEIDTRRERHRVHLRQGQVVSVELSGGQEPLGLVLLETGSLSLPELRKSLCRKASVLYGLSLLRGSFLTAERLTNGLRQQMIRRAARIYALDEARFTFQPGPVPRHALAAPDAHLHPVEVLCLAARHPVNAQRSLGRALRTLRSQRLRLLVAPGELAKLPALQTALTKAEWAAVELLSLGSRLSEILTSGAITAAGGAALIEALGSFGILAVGSQTGARAGARPGRVNEPIDEIRSEVRRGAEPHRLLGVTPGSPVQVLRTAYRKRALLLHPDRWTNGAPGDLPELFAAVANAYRTLSNGAQAG